MYTFTDLQEKIILAYYLFEKKDSISIFSNKFNVFFNTNFNEQTISFEYSKFKAIDPKFNSLKFTDDIYSTIWLFYQDDENLISLKKTYILFKQNKFNELCHVERLDNEVYKISSDSSYVPFDDKPKDIIFKTDAVIKTVARSQSVLYNALKHSNFLCENNCNHILFKKYKTSQNYVEGHHLIPLKYQNHFNNSLDVESNIISLCPSCHKEIHYGNNRIFIISFLYKKRLKRIKNSGISITLDELLFLYEKM